MIPERFAPMTYALFRIVFGLLLFMFGLQKMVGWFGGQVAPLQSLMGAAGVVETVCGFLILLGLFTRPAAFLASGEMAVAYFWMHWGQTGKMWWWQNRGEVVMLYSFVWLFFAAWGAGSFSLDGWRRKRQGA